MPTFGINRLFYFVGRVGHARIGYADMPHVLFFHVKCIMVDHPLLHVDIHYDSLIKYAILFKYWLFLLEQRIMAYFIYIRHSLS